MEMDMEMEWNRMEWNEMECIYIYFMYRSIYIYFRGICKTYLYYIVSR